MIHPESARARLAQTVRRMQAMTYPESVGPAGLEVAGPVGRIPWAEAARLAFRPAALGEPLGPTWSTSWFRVRFAVPAAWAGAELHPLWRSGGEATLWRDGRPVQGLASAPGSAAPIREDARLTGAARGGEELVLHVEAAANDVFGDPALLDHFSSLERFMGADDVPATVAGLAPPPRPRLERCALARFDPEAWRLACDAEVLAGLAVAPGLEPTWAGRLLAGLNDAANAWDAEDRATWPAVRAIFDELLATPAGDGAHELTAVGHAHLDTAWLWPLAETRRKLVRTTASQLDLLDRHPDFRFAAPAAQHHAWLERDEPELWARVREHAARGGWVPVGGTWVEPDCNLPSGESLVRQFLVGQRFFARAFGRRCTELWNPDVFGYTAQLPQILRGAGITRFLTQKLSWNRFTRPEHHTFLWEGPDGSRVLTHFPPLDTYSAQATPAELRANEERHRDAVHTGESLLLFGWGDGGGGPTPAMLERLRRARDLRGLPRTTQRAPAEFFDRLEASLRDPPVVHGELYLQFHRGTYTTHAALKAGNRRAEELLHDVELLGAAAHALGRAAYPQERLARLWEVLLLTQFHDVLPGSSIRAVFEDAARDLEGLLAEGGALREGLLAALADEGPATPVNTLGAPRREVAALPGGRLAVVQAPSCGAGAVVEPADAVRVREEADAVVLENAHLRAVLSRRGELVSLVHRATGREALAGPGALLELYEDRPVGFDAWDVDPSHLERGPAVQPGRVVAVRAAEPLRGEVDVAVAPLGRASSATVTVRLDAEARRLELHARVDWREAHRMLKVVFPLAVRAPRATYETAFGATERPTHASTLADAAQYEVPGHRFADLGEHGFGVALLSESKYGWSARGSELRLSLLRSPKRPDPEADVGAHAFAFALLPHAGDWRDADVVAEARRFGQPLVWAPGAVAPGALLAVDAPGLVLDTVKRAEDADDLVVRLYESRGGRGVARLRCALPFAGARRCTLLEDPGEELEVHGDEVVVAFRPWEVVSLRLGAPRS